MTLLDSVLVYCSGLPGSPVPRLPGDVDMQDSGAGPQIVVWNTARLGPQPTAQTLAAITQSQVDTYYTTLGRTAALTLSTDPAGPSKLQRAVLFTTIDALNVLREWDVSFQAAVAAATTLADLKTRVAALPSLADITAAAAKAAVVSKINSGAAD